MTVELLKKIEKDLKEALFKKEISRISVLRLLLTAIHNKEIELRPKKQELSDEIILEIFSREAKKRRESIEFFKKGDRKDLLKKEEEELKIISSYLPETFADDKIREVVRMKIIEVDARSPQDFGKVMGLAMKELKGKAEGGKVNQILKEELEKIKPS